MKFQLKYKILSYLIILITRGDEMIIVNAKLQVKEEKITEAIKQAETLITASRTHDFVGRNLISHLLFFQL